MTLAWGIKVSPSFRSKVRAIADKLEVDPSFLMACMAFESNETFSPSIMNAAGSGAVGLIQFMPQTAAVLGTTIESLSQMTAEEQLDYVSMYFYPQRGRLKTLSDVYMAILWPAAIGKADDYVLFDQADAAHPKRYIQNQGLDFNHDGKITKQECAARIAGKLKMGLLPQFASEG